MSGNLTTDWSWRIPNWERCDQSLRLQLEVHFLSNPGQTEVENKICERVARAAACIRSTKGGSSSNLEPARFVGQGYDVLCPFGKTGQIQSRPLRKRIGQFCHSVGGKTKVEKESRNGIVAGIARNDQSSDNSVESGDDVYKDT